MVNEYGGISAENDNLIERLSDEKAFYRVMARKLNRTNTIPDQLYLEKKVKRGLRNANGTGVVVGLTKVGNVEGYTINTEGEKIAVPGKLYYRGYSIEDLVHSYIKEDRFGFEEVTYLLLFGDLPTEEELEDFKNILGMKRELPKGFTRDMILTASSRSIMNKLARCILAMYSYDENPDDTCIENVLRQSVTLIGCFPAFVSYAYQAKRASFDNDSLHLHNPLPELSTAENILRMIRPTGEYTALEAKLLDLSLVLHAEHGGGNNSTFTTHLVSSSGTDTYAAIAAAVGALKGPKHGGANIAVINMINDLKNNVKDFTNEKEVEGYLRKVLNGEANDGSGLIYGLGHAIYTLSDPRATVLKGMAKKLAESKGLEAEFALHEFIEKRGGELYQEVKGVENPLPANVDLYSGFVYQALNIPDEIATPLFATGRLSGWCAHRLEEIGIGGKLMRPAYSGVQPYREFLPMAKRL